MTRCKDVMAEVLPEFLSSSKHTLKNCVMDNQQLYFV